MEFHQPGERLPVSVPRRLKQSGLLGTGKLGDATGSRKVL